MSRMNLPARRVSWDGGQMMTWQVGETKTETVFVFITSFIHTPCPLPLKRFTLIILPISCVYPELNHSTFSGADSPVLSIVIFPTVRLFTQHLSGLTTPFSPCRSYALAFFISSNLNTTPSKKMLLLISFLSALVVTRCLF